MFFQFSPQHPQTMANGDEATTLLSAHVDPGGLGKGQEYPKTPGCKLGQPRYKEAEKPH